MAARLPDSPRIFQAQCCLDFLFLVSVFKLHFPRCSSTYSFSNALAKSDDECLQILLRPVTSFLVLVVCVRSPFFSLLAKGWPVFLSFRRLNSGFIVFPVIYFQFYSHLLSSSSCLLRFLLFLLSQHFKEEHEVAIQLFLLLPGHQSCEVPPEHRFIRVPCVLQ